ncbi:MAG TPA: sporulation transcriptional regulator SpoIIID [Candidatus Agathobaculum pullicola]|nr:sporulation transcriptional regulator SpoIIID [Candidatus Agathobaculum pullicola]
MKGLPEERTIRLAQYMIQEGATVRQTAAQFGVSKSTVHKDITTRLKKLNAVLYEQVQAVLQTNKEERHIRGGMATREKYRAQAADARTKRMGQKNSHP